MQNQGRVLQCHPLEKQRTQEKMEWSGNEVIKTFNLLSAHSGLGKLCPSIDTWPWELDSSNALFGDWPWLLLDQTLQGWECAQGFPGCWL